MSEWDWSGLKRQIFVLIVLQCDLALTLCDSKDGYVFNTLVGKGFPHFHRCNLTLVWVSVFHNPEGSGVMVCLSIQLGLCK